MGLSLFSQVTSNRSRQSYLRLCQEKFRLDISKDSSLQGWSGLEKAAQDVEMWPLGTGFRCGRAVLG